MGKSFQTIAGAARKPTPASLLDEFPADYSSAGCSPTWPASASPAGMENTREPDNSGDTFTVKTNSGNRSPNFKMQSGQIVCYKKRPSSCALSSFQKRIQKRNLINAQFPILNS